MAGVRNLSHEFREQLTAAKDLKRVHIPAPVVAPSGTTPNSPAPTPQQFVSVPSAQATEAVSAGGGLAKMKGIMKQYSHYVLLVGAVLLVAVAAFLYIYIRRRRAQAAARAARMLSETQSGVESLSATTTSPRTPYDSVTADGMNDADEMYSSIGANAAGKMQKISTQEAMASAAASAQQQMLHFAHQAKQRKEAEAENERLRAMHMQRMEMERQMRAQMAQMQAQAEEQAQIQAKQTNEASRVDVQGSEIDASHNNVQDEVHAQEREAVREAMQSGPSGSRELESAPRTEDVLADTLAPNDLVVVESLQNTDNADDEKEAAKYLEQAMASANPEGKPAATLPLGKS